MLPSELKTVLAKIAVGEGLITALTGAGISAESGIPTFRGKEGYWTIGSTEYHPQAMATFAMFREQPMEVWRWYLYRRGVCHRAEPNAGHLALAALEAMFDDRFLLITQNVDGLHLRAGNSLRRTYQIHGNIDFMRCADACTDEIFPLPAGFWLKTKDDPLPQNVESVLRCPRCGGITRPHVLWFDEYYDETNYRFNSSLRAADRTALLLVVGSSGATNLPLQVAGLVGGHSGVIVDVNVQPNPFSEYAEDTGGFSLQSSASSVLPEIVSALGG